MVASSPAPAAAGSSVTTVVTKTLAGTRVLMTVDGYSKIKETLVDAGSGSIKSERFHAGGYSWYIEHHPWDGEDDDDEDDEWVGVYIYLDHPGDDDEVTARYELALFNRDGEIITSTQSFYTFSSKCDRDSISLSELNASPLLGDSFQVRCDLTVVEKVAAVAVVPPDLHRHLGGLLASQVGVDVTFHVGGETFTAHKCVLAARSPVFMAELFGPWKENASTGTCVRIDDMEPRVFRVLLHFIYTDALPEMNEDDDDENKVAVAQGLLVAADRYATERLKLICEDILCVNVDAHTAVTMLELADKHGCHRLMEACIKVLNDMLAKRRLQRVGRVVAGGGWLRGPTSN